MLAQQERPTSPLHAVTQQASASPAAQLTRSDTVKAGLTPKRSRRQVESDEYAHSSAASCAPTAAAVGRVTSRPWPSCSA
jgi:hypothetical protein